LATGTYALTRKKAQQNAIGIITRELINKSKEMKHLIDNLTCGQRNIRELAQAQQEFLIDNPSLCKHKSR